MRFNRLIFFLLFSYYYYYYYLKTNHVLLTRSRLITIVITDSGGPLSLYYIVQNVLLYFWPPCSLSRLSRFFPISPALRVFNIPRLSGIWISISHEHKLSSIHTHTYTYTLAHNIIIRVVGGISMHITLKTHTHAHVKRTGLRAIICSS